MGTTPAAPDRPRFRRPPWPFGTRAWRRGRWLLWAILLPLVFVSSLRLSTWAALELEPYDRAVLWATGTAPSLDYFETLVLDHGIFAHGQRTTPGSPDAAPRGCDAASGFSFDRLRSYELQAAASELQALASKAGARPCGGMHFVFNDHPGVFASERTLDVLPQVAWLAAVPLLAVLLFVWGLSERLKLARTASTSWSPATLRNAVLVGAALGLVSVAWQRVIAESAGAYAAGSSSHPRGAATWMLLVILLPFLHELSFRAWAQSLAARVLGVYGGVAFATLLALVLFQSRPVDWPGLIVASIALGWLYHRTQSLPACVLAQATCVAIGLLLG